MQYVCDAGEFTWFRIETEAEAINESQLMNHAVEKYFRSAHKQAVCSYVPAPQLASFEQKIGLKDHVRHTMPRFLTLRDNEGTALVTAMLPPDGCNTSSMSPVIVGQGNSDPYANYEEAIETLADHIGFDLDRHECFPYRR